MFLVFSVYSLFVCLSPCPSFATSVAMGWVTSEKCHDPVLSFSVISCFFSLCFSLICTFLFFALYLSCLCFYFMPVKMYLEFKSTFCMSPGCFSRVNYYLFFSSSKHQKGCHKISSKKKKNKTKKTQQQKTFYVFDCR